MRCSLGSVVGITLLVLSACGEKAPPVAVRPPQELIGSAKPHPDPTREQALGEIYELDSRCGTEAREWFKRNYGNGTHQANGWNSQSDFTNHFNRKLNKCLLQFVGTTMSEKKQPDGRSIGQAKIVVDINENRTLGQFNQFVDSHTVMQCYFYETTCTSESEWDAVAKPLMIE